MKKQSIVLYNMTIVFLFWFLALPLDIMSAEPTYKDIPMPPKKTELSSEHEDTEPTSKPSHPESKWGPEKNGCCISIEVEKKEFFRGYEPINVTVYIKNTGKFSLLIIDEDVFIDNAFDIKDEKGDVPLTEFGKALKKPKENLEPKTINIEPSKEISYTVLLNRIYDMTLKGSYSVTLERKIIMNGNDGKPVSKDGKYEEVEMTSNTIMIEVK